MVVLLVGLALSAISVAAAAAFFIQSNAKTKQLMGESESIADLSILLKSSFNAKSCLKLDMYKGRFRKQINSPLTLTDVSPAQAKRGSNDMAMINPASLNLLRNSVGKSYDVTRIQMIQRTSVIGKDPGRVLADLKVQLSYRTSPDQKKIKLEDPAVLTIPILFDVDNNFAAIGCMQTPQPDDICSKNNGSFNAKATDQICSLAKR